MELDNQLFPHFGLMNSPQPLSPPVGGKRGYKALSPLLLLAREGGQGVEFMHFQNISAFLLLIPDSHIK
ncbi:MAG: hypothetical protein ABSG89_12335 [Bacteroidales bacterium]|jgi:hypothetical protein